MTDKPSYRRLPEDDCIGEEMMYRYIDGKLNSAEMHQVESHTLECALCADALEGLSRVKERDRNGGYWKLPEGIGEAAKDPKVISLFTKPSFYYSAAACVLLLVGFFTMRNFISDDKNAEAPKVAEAGTKDKFAPQKNDAVYSADSVALPDNTKISVNDLKESLRADSMKSNAQGALLPLDKLSNAGPYDIPKKPSTSATGDDMLSDARSVNDGSLDQRANSNDQVTNVTSYTNSEANWNTVTLSDEQHTQVRQDKDSNRTLTSVPQAASNGAGAVSKAADQENATSNSEATGSVMTNTVTNQAVYTDNDAIVYADTQASTDTTRFQPAQTMYPNQETDADVDRSYDAGVKMMTANNPQGSLVFFDDVIAHPSNSHYQDAEWKKAEALILLGKKDDARTLLNKIVSEGGKYKTQAQDKLKTL